MQPGVVIEDIRRLRLQEGIEDVELRAEIRALRVGDAVRLTFQAVDKPCASETLLVRVSRITQGKYRGKLVTGARAPALAELQPGVSVGFTAAHIHSCAPRPAGKPRKPASTSTSTSRTRSAKRAD